ncbi:CLUMA_CG016716, isoform A [Clunio marinus]|uniref:CLUMA_CG016716, isoform A n=1 Tax=Clunio marinus TaxID=568069 RepID=A0A1J1IW09_9DIPT|nr:CLUMA_CG016716, isoform A [Clunio marinus]
MKKILCASQAAPQNDPFMYLSHIFSLYTHVVFCKASVYERKRRHLIHKITTPSEAAKLTKLNCTAQALLHI